MSCSIAGCMGRVKARGWCEMHYCRWRANGDPTVNRLPKKVPISDRLRAGAVRTSCGCLEWIKSRDKDGYGKLSVNRVDCRTHRLSWEQINGPIPTGRMILHTCDNPPCIDPSHLVLGDARGNASDRVDRSRFNYSSGRYNRVKLTPAMAREVRVMSRRGDSRRSISEKFGVGVYQISRIVNNINWKELV